MPTDVPLSVWPTAQATSRTQRAGRYLPLSGTHPARMLPAIAARAIEAYTSPGDLVVDPMCGVGTTLVEAMHLGRDAIGVEYEDRWATLAEANLAHARSQGASGHGEVVVGDARHLPGAVDPAVRGLVALVLTSPPYGPSLHGQVRAAGQGDREVELPLLKGSGEPRARRERCAPRSDAPDLPRLRGAAAPRWHRGDDRAAVVARWRAHRPTGCPRASRRVRGPCALRTERHAARGDSRRRAHPARRSSRSNRCVGHGPPACLGWL